jgi:TonB-linked SusC/RagA family outer membrane protein
VLRALPAIIEVLNNGSDTCSRIEPGVLLLILNPSKGMRFNFIRKVLHCYRTPALKPLLVMKLTAMILMITCIQVSANGYAQNINLSVKNAPLIKVFNLIEKQTDFVFFFDYSLLEKAKKITIRASNSKLKDVLDSCFHDQPFGYDIVDKTIVIKEKPLLLISPGLALSTNYAPYSGRVVNEQGEGLSGASVIIKGSDKGTQTDGNGNFAIEAQPNDVLVASYIGHVAKEIKISGSNNMPILITLNRETESSSEVVVIAYGQIRKKDLTGSVSQVKSKDINAFPSTNVVQALNGRATGVQVMQNNGTPGSPVSVRIRGVNSILGGNEPLYVVDGFPYSGNPTFLQNADVESIEILKDASSIAMYGSRGANGVVMITTKTGKKGDRSNVSFESGYTIQSVTKKMKLLTPIQYAELYNEQAKNDGVAAYFSTAQLDSIRNGPATDWQDLVLRNAPMLNTNVTVSGGNDKTRFSLSGGAFLQEGIVKNTDFKRYSIRGNINHDISKVFNVSYNATLTRISRQLQNSQLGNRGSDVFSAMLMAPPTLSPYLPDGSYRRLTTAYPFISNAIINPLVNIYEISDKVNADRILSNLGLTIKPMDGLSIRITGGIENSNDRTDTYRNIEPSTNSVGSASIGTSQFTNLLNENIANYNKVFNKRHSLGVTAGFAYQVATSKSTGASGTGFLSDVTSTGNIGSAAIPGIPSSGYSKDVLASIISRLNYGLDEKYLFTLSFRRDGSSRYSEGNKWQNFPSAAVAWRVSKENFLATSNTISDLKFRASYGKTGSNSLSPYQTLTQLSSFNTTFGDALTIAYAPGSRLPGNLKWETTDQLDIGVDMGLLHDRIRFTADYYIKRTSNLLNSVQLPTSTGYSITVQNVGEIENKGFEFGVEADIIRKQDFSWNLTANISFNRNKVLKLYNNQDIYGEALYTGSLNDYINLLRPGQPLGIFYGYVETGYLPNGNIKYLDQNNDGLINVADKTYIGDPNPDFIYGVNSVARYKGFEFTLFLQGSQGNDLFNLNKASTLDLGMGLNQPQDIYFDHWTSAKTDTKYPRISNTLNANMSTRFVEDGSYLRFKNIQLAYNLPASKWKLNWLKSAQVYVSGQNMVTITGYSWYDPEVNAYGSSNSIRQGIDYSIYPNSKSVTFGIRCGF